MSAYLPWWPDGKPARYYAGIIARLRPERRNEALGRVPAEVRGLVETHVEIFEEQKKRAQAT